MKTPIFFSPLAITLMSCICGTIMASENVSKEYGSQDVYETKRTASSIETLDPEALKTQNKQLQKQLSKLEQDLKSANYKLHEFRVPVSTKNDSTAVEKIIALESDLKKKEEEISRLQNQLSTIDTGIKDYTTRIKSQQIALDTLTTVLETQKESTEELTTKHKKELIALQEQLKHETAKLQEELNNTENTKAALAQSKQKWKDAYQTANSLYSEKGQDTYDLLQIYSTLLAKEESLKKECSEQVAWATRKVERYREQLLGAYSREKHLETELAEIKDKLQDAFVSTRLLESTERELSTYARTLDEKESAIEKLTAEKNKLHAEIASKTEDAFILSQKLVAAQEETTRLSHQEKKYLAQIELANKGLAEREALTHLLEAKEILLRDSIADLHRSQKEKEDIEVALNEKLAALDVHEQKRAELHFALTEKETVEENLKAELERIRLSSSEDKNQQESNLQQLTAQLHEKTQHLEVLQNEKSELLVQLQNEKTTAEHISADLDRLQQLYAQESEKKDELIQILTKEHFEKSQALATLDTSLRALQSELDYEKSFSMNRFSEITQLKETHVAKDQSLAELQEDKAQLIAHLEELKQSSSINETEKDRKIQDLSAEHRSIQEKIFALEAHKEAISTEKENYLAQLQEKHKDLESALSTAEELKNKLQQAELSKELVLAQLQTEQENTGNKTSTLEAERNAIHQQLLSLEEQKQALITEIEAEKQSSHSLATQLEHVKSNSEYAILQTSQTLEEKANALASLQAEREELLTLIQTEKESKNNLAAELASLKNNNVDQSIQQQQEISKILAALEEEKKQLAERLENEKDVLAKDLSERLFQESHEKQRLLVELETHKNSTELLNAERKLSQELALHLENTKSQSESDLAKSEQEYLQAISALEEEKSLLLQKIETEKAEFFALKNQHEELQSFAAESSQTKEERIQQIDKDHQNTLQELHEAKLALEQLHNENITVKNENEQFKDFVKNNEVQLDEVYQTLLADQQKASQLQDHLQQSEEKKQAIIQENDRLNQHLEELLTQSNSFIEKFQQLDMLHVATLDALKASDEKEKALQDQLNETQQKYSSLNENHSNLSIALQQLEQERENLRNHLQVHQQEAQQTKESNHQLESKTQDLEEKLATLEMNLHEQTLKMNAHESNLDSIAEERTILTSRLNEELAHNRALLAQIEQLQYQIEDLHATANTLHDKNIAMEEALDKTKHETTSENNDETDQDNIWK